MHAGATAGSVVLTNSTAPRAASNQGWYSQGSPGHGPGRQEQGWQSCRAGLGAQPVLCFLSVCQWTNCL